MSDFPKDKLFLKELLMPTLSSVDKLCSVWDGLNIETQLFIFSQIEGDFEDQYLPQRYPDFLLKKIQLKALESTNEFVRYKAAKVLYKTYEPSEEEILINKKIDDDPSDLVKYVSFEGSMPNAEDYFSEPKALRRARFREFSFFMGGESLAKFILSLLDNDAINSKDRKDEIYYILSEYTENPQFKKDFSKEREIDGYVEYSKGKSLEVLWNLVPKLSKDSAYILITTLPDQAGFGNFNNNFWHDKFSNEQIEYFLWRKDVVASDFRKEIFWRDRRPVKEGESRYGGQEWSAACSANFTINDEEFTKVLSLPKDEKIERLKVLAQYASQISLEYLLLIKYTVKELEEDEDSYDDIYEYDLPGIIDNRIQFLYDEGEYSKDELTSGFSEVVKFRLVYLAKKSLSWKSKEDFQDDVYDDRLSFLYIENPQNSWDAYQKILKKWRAERKTDLAVLIPTAYSYEGGYLDEDESESQEVRDKRYLVEGENRRLISHRKSTLNYLKLSIALLVLVIILIPQ